MSTVIFSQTDSRKLGIKYLILSIALHVLAISFLFLYPLLLQSPLDSLFGMTFAKPKMLDDEEELDSIEKNQFLDDVFEHIVVLPSQLQRPYDLTHLPQGKMMAPNLEQIETALLDKKQSPSFTLDPHTLSQKDFSQEMEEIAHSPFFQMLEQQARHVAQVQIDSPLSHAELPLVEESLSTPYDDLVSIPSLQPTPMGNPLEGSALSIHPYPIAKKNETLISHPCSSFTSSYQELTRTPLFTPKYSLPQPLPRLVEIAQPQDSLTLYSFPTLATSALWDADFDVTLTYAPHPEEEGYIFSLSLQPKYDLSQHRLKQHFYFLLDRSNSSENHHFLVFKRAALKALASMHPEDSFNIFILDKNVISFRPTTLLASAKNIQAAEDFLSTQNPGGFLGNGTIYSSLAKILPSIPDDDEMHTAILLTDGNSSMSLAKKRDTFKKWLQKNGGRLSLYAAAVGKDNDLLSLDLLSTECGGKLLYSDTHAAFPRKLAKLILDLKNPIAKEVELLIKPQNGQTFVELTPSASILPSLYSNEPYLIFGTIDQLSSFDLILRGRHREDWIAINKHITFKDAVKGDSLFAKQWKKMQASLCYTQFLDEGNPLSLKQAKDLLNSSQKEMTFR